MNDLAQEAAHVFVPLLSAGAGAAVEDLANRAGKGTASLAVDVGRRIRRFLLSEAPDQPEVESALRRALAAGSVNEDELRAIVNHVRQNKLADSIRTLNVGHSVFQGDITTETFNA